VREEAVACFGAAPGRDRDIADAERARLLREDVTKIEMGRACLPKAIGHFSPDLIAVAANTYAAMHYNVARSGERAILEEIDGML